MKMGPNNHLVQSIIELVNCNSTINVKFFNGVKNLKQYADKSSYYYEGTLECDSNVGYINLSNVNSQGTQFEKIQISFLIPWNREFKKTFFFLLALTPHSIPIVKRGLMSIEEVKDIKDYEKFFKVSKEELNKIKNNNAWILNDSDYDELFFND